MFAESVSGFAFGIAVGLTIIFLVLTPLAKLLDKPLRRLVNSLVNADGKTLTNTLVAAAGALILFGHAVAQAQTATPVPLNIPMNTILSETNTWIATFAPIAAIGIGITIALAVLGYIGSIIKSAFGGSR